MIDFKFQVVLFGTYEDISPKPDSVKYFLNAFSDKELIPTTFQEIGPKGAVNRFSLTNSDETWLIEFGSNRIDIFHTNKNVGVTDFLELKNFVNDCKGIVASIQKKYPKKHNRISLVTRVLLDEMSPKQHDDIYHKLNASIPLYKDNPIVDWNTRTVSRINYEFGGMKEMFNVVSNVKRTKGRIKIHSKDKEVDRIELHFDINTYQGNNDYRFQLEQIELFLDQAFAVEQELRKEYLKLIES